MRVCEPWLAAGSLLLPAGCRGKLFFSAMNNRAALITLLTERIAHPPLALCVMTMSACSTHLFKQMQIGSGNYEKNLNSKNMKVVNPDPNHNRLRLHKEFYFLKLLGLHHATKIQCRHLKCDLTESMM